MAFKLGDVIIDRLQFGYGAKKNGTPLYALTQLNNANIDITADTTDINDKDGNLVYRKYSGKKGEVTAQNAFINLAIIEALSAADAEIATSDKKIRMPMIQTVAAGKTLDITGYVSDTVVVSAIYNGAIDAKKEYKVLDEQLFSIYAKPRYTRYLVDNGLNITSAEKEFTEITGYTDEDIKNKRFNVLKGYCDKEGFEDMILEILNSVMAQCARQFEFLPIIQDAEILKNIIYSGVWTRYEQAKKRRMEVKK